MRQLKWPFGSVFVLATAILIAACTSKPVSIVEARCPAGLAACSDAFSGAVKVAPPARLEPAERFDALFNVILKTTESTKSVEKADGKSDADDIATSLLTEDTRRVTLLLQALYKEYLAMPLSKEDKKAMENGRESIKALEDAAGQRTRVNDLIATATLGGANPQLISILKHNAAEADKDYRHDLRKANWLPHPEKEIGKLRAALGEIDFARKKKDQRLQVEALIHIADDFRAEGKKMDRYFSAKDFSAKDLDNGMHALRRNLRWVTSTIQASIGLYAYTTGTRSARLPELETKYGALKYVKLAEPTKGAYLIDREAMLLLTRYVTELGLLKDFKEAELDLAEVINKNDLAKNAGASEKMAFAIVSKKFGTTDVEKRAREFYEEYLKTDPLKKLKEDLQAQLDGELVDHK